MVYGIKFIASKTAGGPHSCSLAVSDALVVLYDCRAGRKQFMNLSIYSVNKTTCGSWGLGGKAQVVPSNFLFIPQYSQSIWWWQYRQGTKSVENGIM